MVRVVFILRLNAIGRVVVVLDGVDSRAATGLVYRLSDIDV